MLKYTKRETEREHNAQRTVGETLTICAVLNCLKGECGSDSLVLMLESLVNEVKVDAHCCYRVRETENRKNISPEFYTHFRGHNKCWNLP